MYVIDQKGLFWQVVQRYHTNEYLYYFIRNVLTDEEKLETSWKIKEKYFKIHK